MIAKPQIDEFIGLRNKYLETGEKKYRDECLRLAAYRGVPEKLVVDFLDKAIDEKFFKTELGYPEINLMEKLEEMIAHNLNYGIIQPLRARQLKWMLQYPVQYFERQGIHPYDIGDEEITAFIKDYEQKRRKELKDPSYKIDPHPWVKALKQFLNYLERDPTFIRYKKILIPTRRKKEEKKKEYLRVFISKPKPTVPSFQVGEREFPDEGWVEIADDTWFYSEMNSVYNTIYDNYTLFDDWKRLEILLRLKRESGLRQEHARHLQWRDILYDRPDPRIIYDRLEEISVVRGKKYLPSIPTPISDLLAKRIKIYREEHKKAPYNEPGDSNLFKLMLTTLVTPSEEYNDFGRLRYFEEITARIRAVGGFQFCKEKLKDPSIKLFPFCQKMFRWSLGTLYVNIIPDVPEIEQLFGDQYETIKAYYARTGLKDYYKRIGLNSHRDIVTNIFNNEGLREGDMPYGKLKVGRKPKGLVIVPQYPQRVEEFSFKPLAKE